MSMSTAGAFQQRAGHRRPPGHTPGTSYTPMPQREGTQETNGNPNNNQGQPSRSHLSQHQRSATNGNPDLSHQRQPGPSYQPTPQPRGTGVKPNSRSVTNGNPDLSHQRQPGPSYQPTPQPRDAGMKPNSPERAHTPLTRTPNKAEDGDQSVITDYHGYYDDQTPVTPLRARRRLPPDVLQLRHDNITLSTGTAIHPVPVLPNPRAGIVLTSPRAGRAAPGATLTTRTANAQRSAAPVDRKSKQGSALFDDENDNDDGNQSLSTFQDDVSLSQYEARAPQQTLIERAETPAGIRRGDLDLEDRQYDILGKPQPLAYTAAAITVPGPSLANRRLEYLEAVHDELIEQDIDYVHWRDMAGKRVAPLPSRLSTVPESITTAGSPVQSGSQPDQNKTGATAEGSVGSVVDFWDGPLTRVLKGSKNTSGPLIEAMIYEEEVPFSQDHVRDACVKDETPDSIEDHHHGNKPEMTLGTRTVGPRERQTAPTDPEIDLAQKGNRLSDNRLGKYWNQRHETPETYDFRSKWERWTPGHKHFHTGADITSIGLPHDKTRKTPAHIND